MHSHRLLLAPAIAASLLFGSYTGVAMAQTQPPDLVEQLCAADDIDAVNELLAGDPTTELPDGVRDAADPARAAGPIEQVRDALGCETTTPTPDPTTEPPAPTGTPEPPSDIDPPYESCAEAVADNAIVPAVRGVDAAYQANLDSDGDGVACEAGEGPAAPVAPSDEPGTLGGSSNSGSDTVDSVPSGSVDTGYAAP